MTACQPPTYLFSGSAAGPLLTLSTTHRGSEAPRIHDANVRSTAHDDADHKPGRRGNAEPHVLTRGHERVAPGPPGRADGASGTAVTSCVRAWLRLVSAGVAARCT